MKKFWGIVIAIVVVAGIIGFGIYYYYMRYIYPKGQHLMNINNSIMNEEQNDFKIPRRVKSSRART